MSQRPVIGENRNIDVTPLSCHSSVISPQTEQVETDMSDIALPFHFGTRQDGIDFLGIGSSQVTSNVIVHCPKLRSYWGR